MTQCQTLSPFLAIGENTNSGEKRDEKHQQRRNFAKAVVCILFFLLPAQALAKFESSSCRSAVAGVFTCNHHFSAFAGACLSGRQVFTGNFRTI